MNTRKHPRIASVLAYLVCTGLSPAALSADGQGMPIHSTNGTISIWTNPYLNGSSGQSLPPPLSSEQMRHAVAAEMPKLDPENAAAGTNDTSGAHSSVRVLQPTLPDPLARPVLLEPSDDSDSLSSLGVPGQSLAIEANAEDSDSCKTPNPGWQNLDCYLHPWTESPGNILKPYRTAYPWKAIGRLFFHEPDQGPNDFYHHCTAQVISGPPNNLIVTAAHCVVNQGNGKPNKDWVFVPASFAASQPYGQFTYKAAYTLPQWVETGGGNRYDVALLSLQENKHKKPVSYYTGSLGLLLNASYYQSVNILGYSISQAPEGAWSTSNYTSSFGNENQQLCGGLLPREDVLMVGSSLSFGASGGAWINGFYPFESGALNTNLVTSVVSGGILCKLGPLVRDVPNILVGPRFSDSNIGVLCSGLPGGCSTPENLLSLTVTVSANGAVASNPSGIKCSGSESTSCTTKFPKGSTVTLYAVPDREGQKFIGWAGACTGRKPTCDVKLNKDKSVTAQFK